MTKREDGQETRRKLLNAACSVFAEKGYRGTKVADICSRAGANVASVNYYFGDKASLYKEAWQYALEDLGETVFSASPDGSAKDHLREYIKALIQGFTEKGRFGRFSRLYLREMVRNRLYIAAAAAVMLEMNIGFDNIIRIYMGGAKKYAPHNWKKVRPVDRYLAAAYRHIRFDENTDDFGGPHLAYFCWNMIALRWFERHGIRMECDVTTTQCELETIPRVHFRDGGH